MTRVDSLCEKRDSSRVQVNKNRDSSRVIDSSHAITAKQHSKVATPQERLLSIIQFFAKVFRRLYHLPMK